MKGVLLVLALGLCIVGCGRGQDTEKAIQSQAVAAERKLSPEDTLFEQLRSGAFQLDAATESISEALVHAKDALGGTSGQAKEGLQDILDYLDSAGAGIADYAVEPQSADEIRKKYKEFEDQRRKSVQAINDAIRDLEEARGIAASLEEDQPNYSGKGLSGLIDVAIDDLKGAVEALGGKLESDSEQANPEGEAKNSPK